MNKASGYGQWFVTSGWGYAMYQMVVTWNRDRIRRQRLWKMVQELSDKLDDNITKMEELGLKVERGFAQQNSRIDEMNKDIMKEFSDEKTMIQQYHDSLSQKVNDMNSQIDSVINKVQTSLSDELYHSKQEINKNTAEMFQSLNQRLEQQDSVLTSIHTKLHDQHDDVSNQFETTHKSIGSLSEKIDFVYNFVQSLHSQSQQQQQQQQQQTYSSSSSSSSSSSATPTLSVQN